MPYTRSSADRPLTLCLYVLLLDSFRIHSNAVQSFARTKGLWKSIR